MNYPFKIKSKLLFVLLLVISVFARAEMITVKKNGTGDFQVIQQAINSASNGDTILVYPGTYFENLDLQGKTITLLSTYILNGADSLINQTIIDGNHSGSCILMNSGEQNVVIIGFTIQNGTGYNHSWVEFYGGGLYLDEGSAIVKNCIIQNNYASVGGGINCSNCSIELYGNLIRFNQSRDVCGGICFHNSTGLFDTILLNSVYLNYAPIGNDIHYSGLNEPLTIQLDTATVLFPDNYFISSIDLNGLQNGFISAEVQHGKLTEINTDVFVNPEGNDSNSGTSPEQPFKSLTMALIRIKTDSTKFNTIHLSNGLYSASATNEKLPLNLKDFVKIQGESRENTILDAENISRFGYFKGNKEMVISKMKFINAQTSFRYDFASLVARNFRFVVFDSLWFEGNVSALDASAIGIADFDSCRITNCVFSGNNGQHAVIIGNNYFGYNPEYLIQSCRFENNGPNFTEEENASALSFYGDDQLPHNNFPIITNSLFNNNSAGEFNHSIPMSPAVSIGGSCDAKVVNCSFADNIEYGGIYGGALGGYWNSKTKIYNSVFWGNIPYQLGTSGYDFEHAAELHVSYSCIENGINGINLYGQYDILYYDAATNLSDDPLWLNAGDFPYALSGGSPCIDAGTMDLPEGIVLPEFDLAGNPRIWGGTIDMGAYEWSSVGIDEYTPVPKEKEKVLKASPNPFDWQTEITADYNFNGKVKIKVYDNRGQQVKTLADIQTCGGKSAIQWKGDDNNKKPLPPGIYYIVMYFDDREVETLKVVKK